MFTGHEVKTEVTDTSVTYRGTTVAELVENHGKTDLVLRTGGWRTATTAKRMNQALSHWGLNGRVFRKQGAMYLAWMHDGNDTVFEFPGYPVDELRVPLPQLEAAAS